SASLYTSDIPWDGPIGAIRTGYINGEFIANPTRQQMQLSDLNLVMSVNHRREIVMIDASANRLSDDKFLSALQFGIDSCQSIIDQIRMLASKPKRQTIIQTIDPKLISLIHSLSYTRVEEIFCNSNLDKIQRDNAVNVVRTDVLDTCLKRLQATIAVNKEEIVSESVEQTSIEKSIRTPSTVNTTLIQQQLADAFSYVVKQI
ncbi:unnamed protein product, partial [Didymodactylos carnosus]